MAARPTQLKRSREQELVAATRQLFDERGMQDAPIEDIAKAVGIARGLIYRSFSSKEELYVLTVTDYLDELAELQAVALEVDDGPLARGERLLEAYAGFCLRYPAFLDCSLSLMHRPARDLQAAVSDSVWLRLGQGMARCIEPLIAILREGHAAGLLVAEDPELVANVLWTQMLGGMHLARIRVGLKERAPGVPALFAVRPEDVVRTCVVSAMATVGARPPGA